MDAAVSPHMMMEIEAQNGAKKFRLSAPRENEGEDEGDNVLFKKFNT